MHRGRRKHPAPGLGSTEARCAGWLRRRHRQWECWLSASSGVVESAPRRMDSRPRPLSCIWGTPPVFEATRQHSCWCRCGQAARSCVKTKQCMASRRRGRGGTCHVAAAWEAGDWTRSCGCGCGWLLRTDTIRRRQHHRFTAVGWGSSLKTITIVVCGR